MNQVLENLKAYLDTTTKEEIQSIWNSLDKYDNLGPTFEEYLDLSKNSKYVSFGNIKNLENKIDNPKFASDFFLHYAE